MLNNSRILHQTMIIWNGTYFITNNSKSKHFGFVDVFISSFRSTSTTLLENIKNLRTKVNNKLVNGKNKFLRELLYMYYRTLEIDTYLHKKLLEQHLCIIAANQSTLAFTKIPDALLNRGRPIIILNSLLFYTLYLKL